MKKKFRILGGITIILSVMLLLSQCSKDDGAKISKLSGKVTLEDGTVAGGAIVSLSKAPNAADVVANTVADADGMYSFMAVENGTYYLNARYEPTNNNNLLKSAGTVLLTGKEIEVKVSGNMVSDIAMTGMVFDGTATLMLADGWIYDDNHSTTEFEFPFDGTNALFTGHFARTGIDVFEFDEQHPENTTIKAWVDLVSVETGAASPPGGHGRDGITGCIASTFKVVKAAADTVDAYGPDGTLHTNWPNETLVSFDLWGNAITTTYKKQSAIVGTSGAATLQIHDVKAYGTGYEAMGDFTFAGVTKPVTVYFTYLEGYSNTDNTKTFCSFYGTFKFAASADFGVVSSHIGSSDVTVKLSIQFNKAL
jgi:polyisoprenoid-binding protein YceI